MTRTDTRSAILDHGARLVYQKGFNHTGIGEILKAAGVPKGSFYHYFKSKEDFGLALLDVFARMAAAVGMGALYEANVPPLERLRNCFAAYGDHYERVSFKGGCPVGNLCLEMSDQNPAFREKLARILEGMGAGIAGVLEEARAAGEVSQELDTAETAHFILSAWQGSLLQMKVLKNRTPLEVFERMVFEALLKKEA